MRALRPDAAFSFVEAPGPRFAPLRWLYSSSVKRIRPIAGRRCSEPRELPHPRDLTEAFGDCRRFARRADHAGLEVE